MEMKKKWMILFLLALLMILLCSCSLPGRGREKDNSSKTEETSEEKKTKADEKSKKNPEEEREAQDEEDWVEMEETGSEGEEEGWIEIGEMQEEEERVSGEEREAEDSYSAGEESEEPQSEFSDESQESYSAKVLRVNLSLDASEILPHSSEDLVSQEELAELAQKADRRILRRAINEIYARHGLVFKKEENIRHFSAQGWYVPNNKVTAQSIEKNLNEWEKINLYRLLAIEKRFIAPKSGQKRYKNIEEYVDARPEKYSGDWGHINLKAVNRILDKILQESKGKITQDELYERFMNEDVYSSIDPFLKNLQEEGYYSPEVLKQLRKMAVDIDSVS